jgi:glucose-6-phosphate 1-dehydrogenase
MMQPTFPQEMSTMADAQRSTTTAAALRSTDQPAPPCILVIFGASGDLTKRLLMPALYNLACDGLLSKKFALIGIAMDDLTTEQFRSRMTTDIKQFSTRKTFDEDVWKDLVGRLHYTPGKFDDLKAYEKLRDLMKRLDAEQDAAGNIVYYFATPPVVFGMISDNLAKVGMIEGDRGFHRVIVEKPFGTDLPSAIELNKVLLKNWKEEQIFRIDHYLGKETVQNLLAFRFANGIFEPLWNKAHIDHIQFTVSEIVGVEGRGGYYERSGVLRDMMQNHMFQMLAYLTMEPPTSFKPDAIRNEKSKVLDAVRVMTPEQVKTLTVRGQYGPGKKADGKDTVGYRQEADVNPQSRTETFAAAKLFIDNWRWEGVPIYLRSGKALWRRSTEILVQFKKAPEVIFRDTPAVQKLESNQLIFHIQPDQGIELRFQAKTPGPTMSLQKVNMRFDYSAAFEASRGTGYEVMIYNCMIGDAMLFSRSDLVETAWRIAQPMLDLWSKTPADEFPNYPAGSWGPKASFDLIERDGRRWMEAVNRGVIEKVPLFAGCDEVFHHQLAMVLKPDVFAPGDFIIKKGDVGQEMYFVVGGDVDVLDGDKVLATLGAGSNFGETSLLLSEKRTASIRAKTYCDLFVLDKADFNKVLRDHPQFAKSILEVAQTRYKVSVKAEQAFDKSISRMME